MTDLMENLIDLESMQYLPEARSCLNCSYHGKKCVIASQFTVQCSRCVTLGEFCQWPRWEADQDLTSYNHQFPLSDLRQHSPAFMDNSKASQNEMAQKSPPSKQRSPQEQSLDSYDSASNLSFMGADSGLGFDAFDLSGESSMTKLESHKNQITSLVSASHLQPGSRFSGHKRNRNEANQRDGHKSEHMRHDRDIHSAKRQKDTSIADDRGSCLLFACPYRKHNPAKYNLGSFRSCVLTGHNNIARVKGHLYRYHRVTQCPRCKITFKSEEVLENHLKAILEATEPCGLKEGDVLEGFTADVEKKLRSRKKAYPNQTQDEQWEMIYQVLFPDEKIPSPRFEPIKEEVQRDADCEELEKFYEYSRSTLSGLVCGAIDMICTKHRLQIDDILKEQLPVIVSECQQEVFLKYRAGI